MGNQRISINDSSISFSPCYCAPEWAAFLIDDKDTLVVTHTLDVWSVGISLCELVTLDAALKPKYVSIYKTGGSHRKAGFLFLEWLANQSLDLDLDQRILDFDPSFKDMVCKKMLSKKHGERWSLAECLNHPFLQNCQVPGLDDLAAGEDQDHLGGSGEREKIVAFRRNRIEEKNEDQRPPLKKGSLWKLNSNGNLNDNAHWLKRDIWLAANGNLCYFSQKEEKRLVLIDNRRIAASTISVVEVEKEKENKEEACVKPFVFKLAPNTECEEAKNLDENVLKSAEGETAYFATDSAEARDSWVGLLNKTMQSTTAGEASRVQLSANMIAEYREFFKVTVRNRRQKIEPLTESQSLPFKPVFERELWKLNSEGDPMKQSDWCSRWFWLAKNGALCYKSDKENRNLIYYKPEDIRDCSYRKLTEKESCRPHSFELQLKSNNGMEYAPGVFAAESETVLEIILGCVQKYQAMKKTKNTKKNNLGS